MANGNVISCKQFASFVVSQEPVYDKEVLKDIRPFDGMIGYYNTGSFDAYSGTQHTFDRFNSVFPNVTGAWENPTGAACTGQPCDPTENKIGWGWSRNEYSLEKQSWGSDILCFDQIMTKTKAGLWIVTKKGTTYRIGAKVYAGYTREIDRWQGMVTIQRRRAHL